MADITSTLNKKTTSLLDRLDKLAGSGSAKTPVTGKASASVGASAPNISKQTNASAGSPASGTTSTVRGTVAGSAGSPYTLNDTQKEESALVDKLPSDFPIAKWDSMNTKEQLNTIRRSSLSDQEQWSLLNASTPLEVLSLVNAAQKGAITGQLTARAASELTDGALRYFEARHQLVNSDSSILSPLQKRLLHGKLDEVFARLKEMAEGGTNDDPLTTPSPSSTPLPKPGPSVPVITPVPYPKNGKIAYVFYTSNPGAEFTKQAEYQKKELTKQGYKVNLVCTNDVTAFSDAWNHMDPKTGAAVIISHSNGMSLLFEEGTHSNAISAIGKNTAGQTIPSISNLKGPDIGLLYLYACNAGHEELLQDQGINVAQAFVDLPNIDTVYAYDGSVGFGIPDLSPDFEPRLAFDQSGYFEVYNNFDIPYRLGFPSGIQEYNGNE